MTEPHTPIDVSAADLAPHKDSVESLLANYRFRGSTQALADLLRKVDASEKYVMGTKERDLYLAVREGLQVFRAMANILSDKVGLKRKIAETPTAQLGTDPDVAQLRGFCHHFATFAASTFIHKRLAKIDTEEGAGEEPDLSVLRLESSQPADSVIRRLVAPIFSQLVTHVDKGAVFADPGELVEFTRAVFARYAELAETEGARYTTLAHHVQGYRFRILDDFCDLEGYRDVAVSSAPATASKKSFQPIQPEEIVGNRAAKRKIVRYIERLALYDATEGMNPVLALGGLSWSNLFDGPPGTGKSSIFRLAMTQLADLAEHVGLPYHIVTIDQSIKDEYYGKTGKLLLEKLRVTQDDKALSLVVFDDIDLLTSTRQDAQGGDNDVNNIIMQYMDGVFPVRRGNVVNLAASNEPTGVDDALRNRFNDRLLIDGPTTAEDFADMVMLLGGDLIERKLLRAELGYQPFESQDTREDGGGWSNDDVASYMAERFQSHGGKSVLEFGQFVAALKEDNPLITGRSMKAILEAIKERSASFDVPREWFEDHSLFLDLPYAQKVQKLAELYAPIDPDVLFQEAQRYFDSEERFRATEASSHVERGYNSRLWNVQSELRFLEDQIAQGRESDLGKLHELRMLHDHLAEQKSRLMDEAIREREESVS